MVMAVPAVCSSLGSLPKPFPSQGHQHPNIVQLITKSQQRGREAPGVLPAQFCGPPAPPLPSTQPWEGALTLPPNPNLSHGAAKVQNSSPNLILPCHGLEGTGE